MQRRKAVVLEQQALAKEVASSSDDQLKPDFAAYMQVSVLHYQSMMKNAGQKGDIATRGGKMEKVAGTLALFLDNWSNITQDQWVLKTV